MNTAKFRVVSKIYEANLVFPIVIHIFQGVSRKQAKAFYEAHKKSDEFLRGCADKEHFVNFSCREEHYEERWDGKNWVR